MKLIIITKRIPLRVYENMTNRDLYSYVALYSGRLLGVKVIGNEVLLIIEAPSTWRYMLGSAMLLPYRYI